MERAVGVGAPAHRHHTERRYGGPEWGGSRRVPQQIQLWERTSGDWQEVSWRQGPPRANNPPRMDSLGVHPQTQNIEAQSEEVQRFHPRKPKAEVKGACRLWSPGSVNQA